MARHLGEEALDLHAHGKFADAFDRFATAEKIAHSPVFVLWMARSKRALGALLDARSLYEKVAAEELPADASAKWISARDDGRTELSALVRTIPRLRVELPDAPSGTTLEVDGAQQNPSADLELDPGAHTVRATTPGRVQTARTVRLEEGPKPTVVALRFGKSGSLVPGGVVLGIGAASLGAGAVTGAYALALAGQVKDGCVGTQCLAADKGKADSADKLGRASTGLLIAGGVVAAVGVTLLVVRPGSSSTTTSLDIGPGRASLTTRF
jgi:hypothetical protein